MSASLRLMQALILILLTLFAAIPYIHGNTEMQPACHRICIDSNHCIVMKPLVTMCAPLPSVESCMRTRHLIIEHVPAQIEGQLCVRLGWLQRPPL